MKDIKIWFRSAEKLEVEIGDYKVWEYCINMTTVKGNFKVKKIRGIGFMVLIVKCFLADSSFVLPTCALNFRKQHQMNKTRAE